MGFFGVLSRGAERDVRVLACHLNIWSLDGLLGRRLLYVDVGLRLGARRNRSFDSISVGLPFDVRSDRVRDLTTLLRDQRILNLIFAKDVSIVSSAGHTLIDYGDGPIELMPVECELERQGPQFSLWKLQLAAMVTDARDVYVRLRFNVQYATRVWEWRRRALAKSGAVLDIRVADVRGVSDLSGGEALLKRMVPIESLFLFVIAPIWLRATFASPKLHYARIFEGRVWERYLGRATGLFRREKLVIYQWRGPERTSITYQQPFRGYLELTREPEITAFRNHLGSSITVLALAGLWYYAEDTATLAVSFWRAWATTILASLGAVIALPFLWKALNYWKLGKQIFTVLREGFLRLEERVFRLFAHP